MFFHLLLPFALFDFTFFVLANRLRNKIPLLMARGRCATQRVPRGNLTPSGKMGAAVMHSQDHSYLYKGYTTTSLCYPANWKVTQQRFVVVETTETLQKYRKRNMAAPLHRRAIGLTRLPPQPQRSSGVVLSVQTITSKHLPRASTSDNERYQYQHSVASCLFLRIVAMSDKQRWSLHVSWNLLENGSQETSTTWYLSQRVHIKSGIATMHPANQSKFSGIPYLFLHFS